MTFYYILALAYVATAISIILLFHFRPSSNSAGQQCCYGSSGILIKGAQSGGSADVMSPKADYNIHLVNDLLPYVLCCKAGVGLSLCGAYYEERPSGNEMNYIIPVPGWYVCMYV